MVSLLRRPKVLEQVKLLLQYPYLGFSLPILLNPLIVGRSEPRSRVILIQAFSLSILPNLVSRIDVQLATRPPIVPVVTSSQPSTA